MFCRREDGLERVFWPFIAGAAVICAVMEYIYHWKFWMFIAMLACWSVTLLAAWVLFVWLLSLTVDLSRPEREDHPAYRRIALSIVGVLCRFGRLRIRTKGMERLPAGRFLLVGNHRSNYDPIATLWALRRRGVDVAFITKPENMRIPLVRFIHKINFLVIDRDNPRNAVATINAAADLLERDVVNMGVYPEGTRSKAVQMGPFHNAVFKIAQKAKVPIVVAAISGTEKISKNMPWRHTDVTIDLCDVIDAGQTAEASTKDLGQRVRESLERAFQVNDRG